MYYIYILLCADNSFYVGYTKNLKQRIANHKCGYGSSYLKSKLPVELVYYEVHQNKEDVIKRERQIKNWSRVKKINLIKLKNK